MSGHICVCVVLTYVVEFVELLIVVPFLVICQYFSVVHHSYVFIVVLPSTKVVYCKEIYQMHSGLFI